MKRVGVAELKNNLSRYLRVVEGGDEIEVTDHDRPIARLGPVDEGGRTPIRPASRDFLELRDRRSEPLDPPVSVVDLLLEDRRRR